MVLTSRFQVPQVLGDSKVLVGHQRQGPQGPKGNKGQDGAGITGVKYVRWGKTKCSSGAQLVYEGENCLLCFRILLYC